jgi:hypothetical protein
MFAFLVSYAGRLRSTRISINQLIDSVGFCRRMISD